MVYVESFECLLFAESCDTHSFMCVLTIILHVCAQRKGTQCNICSYQM